MKIKNLQCDYCLNFFPPIVHTFKSFPRPALIAYEVYLTDDNKTICKTCLEKLCTEEWGEILKIKEMRAGNI